MHVFGLEYVNPLSRATRDRQFLQDDNKQAIALLVLLASTTGLRSSSLSQELTAPKIEELIPSSLTMYVSLRMSRVDNGNFA